MATVSYNQAVAGINAVKSTSAAEKAAAIKNLSAFYPTTPSSTSGSSSSSSNSSSNIVKYDAKTGKLLTSGATTTDALGNVYKQGTVFNPTKTITPTDIITPTPVLPTPVVPTYDINSILKGIEAGTATQADIYNLQRLESDKTQGDIKKMFENLISEKPSQEQLYSEALQQSGKEEAQRLFNEKQAQLNQIVTKAQAAQLSVIGQGRGIPEVIIGGQQAQIAKEAAIQALPVQAELAAAQGNLEMANENLNTWYKIKSEDAASEFAFKTKIADYAIQFATKDQADRISFIKDAYKEQADKTQANLAAMQNIALEVAKNGKSTTFINNIDPKSSTAILDTIRLAGSGLVAPSQEIINVGDSVVIWDKNQNKIIKTLYGGTRDIPTRIGNASNFSSVINQTASFGGTNQERDNIKNNLTNYINNQDYNAAYTEIKNNVGKSLTGTTKTRFEDASIDSAVLSGLKTKIKEFETAGGDTGLLKGTAEQITRKLGQVKDPALAALAVGLQREFQFYRNTMTGAAFSPKESREYAAVNPKTTNNFDLNMAVIDGAISQLDNRVNETIDLKVSGAGEIRNLINKSTSSTNAKTQIDSIYKTANDDVISIIDKLFGAGYDDTSVLEYLQINKKI